MTIAETCKKAKDKAEKIAHLKDSERNSLLKACVNALQGKKEEIFKENRRDIEDAAKGGKPGHFIDRLTLNEKRFSSIIDGFYEVEALSCPVGEVLEEYTVKNGLHIRKIRVPMGVVGFIYEARPNVTADAVALCIKSGNAVVLRGGKDAINSNRAIISAIKEGISGLGYDSDFIQLIEDLSREGTVEFMRQKDYIDVLIPRGGAGLIQSTLENSRIPVIETGTGNCHVYIHESAELKKALDILINAKTTRVSVCNSCESLLIDEGIADKFLPAVLNALKDSGVEVRGCSKTVKYAEFVKEAEEEDFFAEYLDMIISVKVVKDLNEAVAHINKYGTHHSDSIITEDKLAAERFLEKVDSAAVYVNASTRFTDGYEFGLGAEIGISTQKLHARGPMGLKEMTSYKYQILGEGQIRI